MTMPAISNPTKVITGVVRLSYANVWEPKSILGGAPKYGTSILIPKEDTKTMDAIEAAIVEAIDEGRSKWGGKVPRNLKTPLRDGDEERPDDEVYIGHYFINANSNAAPGIVDLNRRPITNEDEVYSGCYCRVSINFYPFAMDVNKGIACGLNNIQKVRDGERLGGGRAKAEDDFDDAFFPDDEDLDFL